MSESRSRVVWVSKAQGPGLRLASADVRAQSAIGGDGGRVLRDVRGHPEGGHGKVRRRRVGSASAQHDEIDGDGERRGRILALGLSPSFVVDHPSVANRPGRRDASRSPALGQAISPEHPDRGGRAAPARSPAHARHVLPQAAIANQGGIACTRAALISLVMRSTREATSASKKASRSSLVIVLAAEKPAHP